MNDEAFDRLRRANPYPLLTEIAVTPIGPPPPISLDASPAGFTARTRRLRWENRKRAQREARALLAHVADGTFGG